MTQIEKLIENLEAQYRLSIEALIGYYLDGLTRSEIAEALGTTQWTIRLIASALNLRFQKEYRANDYALFLTRFDESAESKLGESLEEKTKECDYLAQQLYNKEKALNNSRVMLNAYRKEVRKHSAEDTLRDSIISAISDELEKPRVVYSHAGLTDFSNTGGTQFALLSDIHAEAYVSNDDTGLGEFTWEDMESRVAELFDRIHTNKRGEERLVIALGGDNLDGLIHDTLESTTKPTMKALVDLSTILAGHINGLSALYSAVDVYLVNGNHSRLTQHIKSNAKGFDLEYVLGHMIHTQLDDSIQMQISTNGLIKIPLTDDKYIGLHHGDLFRGASGNDLNVLQRFSQVFGSSPTHLMQGHLHNFRVNELPTGGIKIVNGALVNPNAYVATNGILSGTPSQTIGAFTETGEIHNILPVFFTT